MIRASLIALLAAGLVSGCAMTGAPMETPPTRPPFATAPAASPTPSGVAAAVPPARWQAILDDLSARGVSGTPTLVSAQRVTWPNGALGCPQPGVMYTQALVSGLQVVVSVEGKEFDYRFGRTDRPRLCAGR